MKRVALVAALVLGIVAIPASAGAQESSEVSFVHASSGGAVDVFAGPAGGSQFALVATDVSQGEVVPLGSLASGNWRFVLCGHTPAPPPSIGGCPEIPAPTTLARNIHIGVGDVNEVVYGTAADGGVRLVKLNVDTKCASPGGRLTVANVSQSDPATVSVDGAVVEDNLGNGRQVKVNVAVGLHALTVTDGASLDLASDVDVGSQTNTIAHVAGTPDGYTVLVHQVPLACDAPPPTDPTFTPVGQETGAAAAGANRSAGVNPRYAG